jgi:hypothetical protein
MAGRRVMPHVYHRQPAAAVSPALGRGIAIGCLLTVAVISIVAASIYIVAIIGEMISP